MEVVILLAFVGLILTLLALILFGQSLRSRDYQHAERIALFALRDDDARAPNSPPGPLTP